MTAGRNIKSLSSDWGTPLEYINIVKNIFNGKIFLDPCSNKYSIVNAKVSYSLPLNDGLKENWNYPTIYVNPPYGRDYERKTTIKDWLNKCTKTHLEYKSEIIALIPVATNTKHWQNNIFLFAISICFLKVSRLKFLQNGNPNNQGAPMSCALIYWGTSPEKFEENTKNVGKVFHINKNIL
jgi:hypothetical protein